MATPSHKVFEMRNKYYNSTELEKTVGNYRIPCSVTVDSQVDLWRKLFFRQVKDLFC